MTIIKLLKKIKKTLFWYFVIKYIIKPIYDFVWLNVINIHGRILYFSWFSNHADPDPLARSLILFIYPVLSATDITPLASNKLNI